MASSDHMPASMTPIQRVNAAVRRVPGWLVYALGAAYGVWLFYLGATGGLGAEPINALERRYGEVAIQLILLSLAVTPLRRYLGVNMLPLRRAIGVLAFFFVLAHFLVWAVLDVQTVARVWDDILKRPYVTIGMAGFILLIPLALTSNNVAVRKLGPVVWRRLHRLAYPAAVLGAVHYVWLAKGFQIEPLVYLAITLGLLATRIARPQARQSA